jgi:hypothetical protein
MTEKPTHFDSDFISGRCNPRFNISDDFWSSGNHRIVDDNLCVTHVDLLIDTEIIRCGRSLMKFLPARTEEDWWKIPTGKFNEKNNVKK